MLCPKCQKQLPNGANFCNGCGENLKTKPVATKKRSLLESLLLPKSIKLNWTLLIPALLGVAAAVLYMFIYKK